jgi:hypothetical protein
MRAHRTWVVGAENQYATIEDLQLELAALNRCIGVLKKTDANPDDIELLNDQALTLAERIDEARSSNPPEALGWLFERESLKVG